MRSGVSKREVDMWTGKMSRDRGRRTHTGTCAKSSHRKRNRRAAIDVVVIRKHAYVLNTQLVPHKCKYMRSSEQSTDSCSHVGSMRYKSAKYMHCNLQIKYYNII